MSRTPSKDESIKTLTMFVCQFPNCFSFTNPRPMKANIHNDIYERLQKRVSKSKIKQALFVYTNSPTYLNAFRQYDHRIDLEGNEVEKIEYTHHRDAKTKRQKFEKLAKPARHAPQRTS